VTARAGNAMTPAQWGYVSGLMAIYLVLLAVFPRLAYRLRWSSRLGPRGLLGYVAFRTALGFAVQEAFIALKRYSARVDRVRGDLARQTGREPTDRELFEHLGWTN
jgi:hypothetical protein